MDGHRVESGDRMHQGVTGLQALLCRAHVEASAGDGDGEIREGFCSGHARLWTLGAPLKWKNPKFVFVNSMSDLFHKFVPLKFIEEVFAVMNEADHHTFQVLTKRPGRARALSRRFQWTSQHLARHEH